MLMGRVGGKHTYMRLSDVPLIIAWIGKKFIREKGNRGLPGCGVWKARKLRGDVIMAIWQAPPESLLG